MSRIRANNLGNDKTYKLGRFTYRFVHDVKLINTPGHGYLCVPITEIMALKLLNEVSAFSYFGDGWALLEEDCDAGLYISARRLNTGKDLEISDFYFDGEIGDFNTLVLPWYTMTDHVIRETYTKRISPRFR